MIWHCTKLHISTQSGSAFVLTQPQNFSPSSLLEASWNKIIIQIKLLGRYIHDILLYQSPFVVGQRFMSCLHKTKNEFYLSTAHHLQTKKQSSPATRHGGAWRERRYSSYSFLTSALDGVNRHAPAALCPGVRIPGTHCTGGWVGLRAGLDTEARVKILCPWRGSNPDRPVVQSVVRHYTDWATRLLPATYIHSPLCEIPGFQGGEYKESLPRYLSPWLWR
jgi:hypothetical protein